MERVEIRSVVVGRTLRGKAVIGIELSGSKAEGPGSVNVDSERSAVSRQFKEFLAAQRKA